MTSDVRKMLNAMSTEELEAEFEASVRKIQELGDQALAVRTLVCERIATILDNPFLTESDLQQLGTLSMVLGALR